MEILYLPEVEDYLFELIELLYRKNYFSFLEEAVNYVVRLRKYIEEHIGTTPKHKAS